MRKIVFFFFLFLAFNGFSQVQVTDSTKISLITCSPGKAVYEQFGHTAIRFYDPTIKIDLMFNYGIFSFNKPNFYGRFIKGETDYQLGTYNSEYFFPEYQERNSSVTEQELNLTKEQKQRLMDALFLNYLPENREYRYNFIFDNCATRPRIKIEEALAGETLVYSPENTAFFTFRHWVGKYVGFHTWTKFGIDLLLGKDADRLATKMEATFLPEDLMVEFREAKIKSSDGQIRPLIKSEKVLVEKRQEELSMPNLLQKPTTIALLVLLIGLSITYFEFIKKKNWKIIDSILLIFTGLAGVVVFYLMFFSVHPLIKSNFNILWCNPLNTLVGIILWVKKCRKTVLCFQWLNTVLFLGAFVVFIYSIQHLNVAFVPFILLLFVRSVFWIYKQKVLIKK
ncbi:MAG: DUF4105 domain-containing protein [Paludibacteraceae bacterium]